ncbi:phosphonate ABC transporter, permease protein PhnE [Streptomyces shenzhenensis]|uniref:phosphonate ABC transporter, permease protein PhnE n=1 Tax=Streptomyces shenzhenensis TaxID=943815 RepID=UPI0033E42864
MTDLRTPPAPVASAAKPAPQTLRSSRSVLAAVAAGTILVAGLWSISSLDITPTEFVDNWPHVTRFFERAMPIEFPGMGEIVTLTLLTLAVVVCGTMLAAVLSVPVALLAARNVGTGRLSVLLGRFLGLYSRAAPDIVLALVFASVLGNGPLPGILALGIHSVGMVSKLFAEAIEQIDEGPRRALRAAGAGPAQEFFSAILPQVTPSWIASVLHRSDINLRASAILGFVGVGGLGDLLDKYLGTLDYGAAIGVALILFLLCLVFEVLSSALRRSILTSAQSSPGTRQTATRPADPRRRPWTSARVRGHVFAWSAVAVVAGSVWTAAGQAHTSGVDFWANTGYAWGRMWPPALSETTQGKIGPALLETAQIALAATLLSLVPALVLGVLSARNVTPHPVVRTVSRGILVSVRAIPELILALLFIIMTGMGSTAGALALAVGGIGLLGRLAADSIEEVPPGPERALRAVGASRTQVFAAATFPLSLPALVSHTFYLFDSNLRGAVILGIVGGGGIGFMLLRAQSGDQHEMTALLLCILALITVVEFLAMGARRAFR